MKKTQLKDSTRNIKKRIVSYLSVCLVIMLGIGAYLTTRYMESGICREAAGYMSSHSFKNFEMISSLGVSDASIEEIKNVEGVTDAEGVMLMTATVSRGYSKRTATIVSETERISVPEVIEGRMPTAQNECAMAEDFSEKSGVKVGDIIKVQIKSGDMDYPLYRHKFVVTGLVKHPDYIHRKLTNVVVMPLAAFNEDVTDGYFTRVYIKSEDPSLDDFYSEKAIEEAKPLYNELEELAKQLEISRAEEFKRNAHAEIDDEWEKALAKMDGKEDQINDYRNKLNKKLAEGRKKLNGYQAKLNKTVKYYEKKLKEARAELDKIENYCDEIDKALPSIKEYIKKLRKEYNEEMAILKNRLALVDVAIKTIEAIPDDEWETPEAMEKRKILRDLAAEIEALADEADAFADEIDKLQKEIEEGDFMEIAEKIKEISGGAIDPTKAIQAILDYDTDGVRAFADEQLRVAAGKLRYLAEQGTKEQALKLLRDLKEWINESIKETDALMKELDKYEKYIAEYEAKKDKYIKEAEKKWKNSKNLLEKKRKEYQDKIDDGWNRYYAAKRKYEAKLAEAIALLSENREKAEKKLEEARAEVDAVDCKWLALDRTSNPGFLDIKSQLQALNKTGTLFGVMFILITAMVCLSTLAIIIEEQKKLIGTVKAFGFHKREVLGKYLLFGVTAAILGSILAFGIGTVLSQAVLNVYNGQRMYPYESLTTVIRLGPTVLISLTMIAICALSSIIACSDILKSPASMLMKGETLSKNKAANRKKKESKQKGSLYSKLILRNMKDDKARVIVSTVIVAACCMLIGLGVTVKMSFSGTVDKQANEVNHFDLRVDFTKAVTDEDKAAIDKVIAGSGADYVEGMYDSRLYRSVDGISGLNILCAKPDEIEDYIGTYLDGKKVAVPEDGILIPLKMAERNSLSVGDSFIAYDSEVEEHEIKVAGTFNNYFARMSIMTPESYKTYFGEDYKSNCRYLHLNGADSKELRKAILAVNPNVSFDTPTSFRPAIEANAKLFNIVTYVTTGIAILMSFMILTNLANIFVTRKKTELSVMRINGFSIKQTKGYLAKESILTTAIGLIAGVLIGSVLTSFAIHMIEPIDFQFDRSFRWIAWAIAAGLEGLFALIIYSSTFRKVKNLNLRDIT